MFECFGVKETNAGIEPVECNLISDERINIIKFKFQSYEGNFATLKNTLFYVIDKNESYDIYVNNMNEINVLDERTVTCRKEWTHNTCSSWNNTYNKIIKQLDNIVYIDDGKIIFINTCDD